MNARKTVTSGREVLFFFGVMSPYSWFAAERIGELIPHARWVPIYAGALFSARGRRPWGLTEQREESMSDCEARALAHGLGELVWPRPWPTLDLRMARACLYAGEHGRLESFALTAMRLAFKEGMDLAHEESVAEAASRSGLPAKEAVGASEAPRLKDALRERTELAIAQGVVGIPTVRVAERLFWGDDRLAEAAAAAR